MALAVLIKKDSAMDDVSLATAPDLANEAPANEAKGPSPYDLATQLVGKLCHDFISPTGAIISGLDLLSDPQAADMRDDAINLIQTSANKMVTLVHFARVAFGAASSAEAFSARELNKTLSDVFSTMRANLEFQIEDAIVFEKPAARALMNLGYIAGNALPTGGIATLTREETDTTIVLKSDSKGNRARLKPEAIEGLAGQPLSDGLTGQWIQPFWLYSVVKEAGGTLEVTAEPDHLSLTITLPKQG
ncbi:histidine phosphotransferase family protein [Asticcacaulis sp. BYS171W]|uniref:Histidine phosphotransferase family protein n=1 Tax=Asticcacaulis aquaticus TaxID=2984212 RepID=A0ABT5HT03_9CAUL|nr:histidine phosphotransferase family protein [Asticcacaulis aquaticus]MDC7683206.1 histidine phosphotransferase family protein [Asticcacaulis aquaticus]